MANDTIADHLALALHHLAEAQNNANRAASDSFMRDIPNGHPTAYARAAIRADRISVIRENVRALLYHPAHRARSMATVSTDVSGNPT